MNTKLLLLIAVLLSGCVDLDGATDVPNESEIEQEISGYIAPAPADNSNCGWAGGQYWCQDYYTGKWCTGSSQLTVAWDYVPDACTWNGKATDPDYCWSGACANCWYGTPSKPSNWFYWLAHHHCP